ncbi:MAG: hypothetical protein NC240_10470 [Clostridium sp.]|nr:hypothetical protein [Clostridium sp.]
MESYSKMLLSEKEIVCQNIYTNEILRSADCLQEYKLYAKAVKRQIPPSCYTNFRDALFHFRKMCNSWEEHEIMQQAFAVKEHLGRARTDAKVSILVVYAKIIEELLLRNDITKEMKNSMRKILHKIKNVVMVNRIEGMMMSEIVINYYSDDDISEIVAEYLDFVQDKCEDQFKKIRDMLKTDMEKQIELSKKS